MNPPKIEATDLSRGLADDIERVVEALGIDVRRRSRRMLYAFAPWGGAKSPKLEIELYPRPGKWNDWQGGIFGDAYDLVACVLGAGRKDRRAAYPWAKAHLGLDGQFDREAWTQRRAEAETRAKAREAKAARELTEARRTAQAQWLAARPLDPGDHAWRYLAARGVDVAALGRRPRAVRYSPAQPWWDGESSEPAHVGPAILSAMTLPDGRFGSLHRIWIDPARPGEKAALDPPRKMWPSSDGAVIRLWRGESGKSEADAAKAGALETVVVCEGVEDGLSIALMTPELRIIAAGSLPGLLSLTPPRCARRLVVAADNDWGKPEAERLLTRALQRFKREFGLSVGVARSPEGKDFNDLLRGGA